MFKATSRTSIKVMDTHTESTSSCPVVLYLSFIFAILTKWLLRLFTSSISPCEQHSYQKKGSWMPIFKQELTHNIRFLRSRL